jgi:HlyD family secretion protein
MSQLTNNRRKRSITRIVVIILVLIIGPAAFLIYNSTRDRTLQVRAAVIESGDITSMMTINTVIHPGSVQKTTISQQKVKSVLVKPGDQVKKGDILVTFDLSELQDQLQAAKDARAQAEEAVAKVEELAKTQAGSSQKALQDLQKQISRLSAGLSGATGAISQLGQTIPASLNIQNGLVESVRAKLAEIDPSAPDAQEQIEAVLAMLTAGVQISASTEYQKQLGLLDQSLTKMNSAVTGLLGSLTNTSSLTGLLGSGSMSSQLTSLASSAQTAVAQTIQAEKLAQQALDSALESIVAETDGMIAVVNAEPGEYAGTAGTSISSPFGSSLSGLGTNQEPVIVLYDNTRPKAFFQANRYDSNKIAVGMPVIYHQDGKTWYGKITYKGRIASNADLEGENGTSSLLGDVSSVSGLSSEPVIEVEMSIEGDDLTSLTLGFNLEAEIQTASAQVVLLLPAEAMKKELGKYFVFVIGADSRLIRRVITPGIQSDTYVEIKEGLAAGEKVVLNPTNDLAEGRIVREKNDE